MFRLKSAHGDAKKLKIFKKETCNIPIDDAAAVAVDEMLDNCINSLV